MRRLLLVFALCAGAVPAAQAATVAPAAAGAPFTAKGSVNQVYVTDLPSGVTVDLKDASDTVVDTGTTDAQGSYLFRKVPAGTGYQVDRSGIVIGGIKVTDPDVNPGPSWYQQQVNNHPLNEGYDYLTTRDGTTLSVNITFPNDGSSAPWPVVLDYSGYDPSQPGTVPQEAAVYQYQGYVVVGVNMRGTGCSGGAFDFMETLQSLDGYDVVETLARQSWSNGHVGMVGISYSGYSQLYVGATNPPHLDAITPLSPFADTYTGILYPGGILNDGFAVDWATERNDGAKPKARPWAKTRINNGDTTCAHNQLLRLQSPDLLDRIESTPFADLAYSYLDPETFVDKIKMPTFLSSQWQDEQTGGSAANLVELFDPDTKVFANFTNGTHVEPMAPSEIYEAMVFIDLYVGHRIPHTANLLSLGAPAVLADLFGAPDRDADFGLPFNGWPQQPSYEAALAYYEAKPHVRIRWENGTVSGKEGLPIAAATTRHSTWPLTGLTNEKWYLQPDGALAASAPTVPDTAARASSSYTYDPTTKRNSTYTGSTESAWAPHPDYTWDVLDEGNALSFVTPAYASKAAYAGQGSVDLWVRSSAADTDFEATLTEVRPDGKEVFIQSGWLRGSHRTLDEARSTELVPFHWHQEADASPLPAGQFTPIRIELFPFAHVLRPGSKLRLNIEAPGGNQPFWAFDALPGPATNSIGHSAGMPSRVVLPRVPANQAPSVPAAYPACALDGVTTRAVSYRNQPCRTYSPDRMVTQVTGSPNGRRPDLWANWIPFDGPQPTTYTVTASLGAGAPAGAIVPAPKTVPGSATEVLFEGLRENVPYEFTVTPHYPGGDGPTSDASLPLAVKPVGLRLWGDYPSFVENVLLQFQQHASQAEIDAGAAALEAGQDNAEWVASLRRDADSVNNVDPVTRLYLAYFKRVPEWSGQRYWAGQRRLGVTLNKVSDSFAASSEFKNTYGALTNKAFVDLVYQNVLGRPGDSGGVAYWTNQLNLKRKTRGQVMTGFSESNEFKTKSRNTVDVASLYIALFARKAKTAEWNAAMATLGGGGTLTDIVRPMLDSVEFDNRSI